MEQASNPASKQLVIPITFLALLWYFKVYFHSCLIFSLSFFVFENSLMSIMCSDPIDSLVPSFSYPHHYFPLPKFMCSVCLFVLKSTQRYLSLFNAVCMCMRLGPSPGAWVASNVLHSCRKQTLCLPPSRKSSVAFWLTFHQQLCPPCWDGLP